MGDQGSDIVGSTGPTRQQQQTFLVFGATGGTGRHFVDQALAGGHTVRAIARTPSKLSSRPGLVVREGVVPDVSDLDDYLRGVDSVAIMIGDLHQQQTRKINTEFVRALVPAMRRQHVPRLLYQAGGLSVAPGRRQPLELRALRATLGPNYRGQHEDNEAVMQYLLEEAADLDWVVHRAGIGSDGPSRGVLSRSSARFSVATFQDVAGLNHRLLADEGAIHTCDFSTYRSR